MKNIMLFLLTFILLFHFPSGAQTTGTQLSFNSAWGVDYESNMVAQPSAQKNLAGFVGGVGASVIRDISVGNRIDNIASYQVAIAGGGYAEFLLKTPNDDQTSGDCGFNARIKGPITGIRAEITNGSLTVLAGVDLLSVDSWTDFEPVRFPCGAAGTRRIRFRNTTGSGIVFNVGRLFYGRVKRDSAVPTIPLTPYTPSVTGLGSGSGTFQYANYTVDTNGIAEVCLRFTKDGTNGLGTSEVTFSLPPAIANFDSANGSPKVGTGFSGITNSNVSLAVESSSGIFAYNGSTRIRGVDLTAGAIVNGCVRYKVAGFGVQPAVTAQNWNFNWRSYATGASTPAMSAASGTLTNYVYDYLEYRRQGPSMFIRAKIRFTGSPGTWTNPEVPLPPGITTTGSTVLRLPGVVLEDAGTNIHAAYFRPLGTTLRIVQQFGPDAGAENVSQGVPFGWTSGDFIEFETPALAVSENGVPWQETWNALQLNGSVTAGDNNNSYVIESVRVLTTCSSNPCTIASRVGNRITSITRSSTGDFAPNFSGLTSPPEWCGCDSVGAQDQTCRVYNITSLTTATMRTYTTAGALQDPTQIFLRCFFKK